MGIHGIGATALAGVLTAVAVSATTGSPPESVRPQAIHWHGCHTGPDDDLGKALDAAGARCGEVTVPVDYARPHGRTISVALARVRATDPAHRRGVLMLDPGGPGGSAMELTLVGAQMPDVAARYDLVGMDPRFVGRSSPIACRWKTDTFLRSAGPDRGSYGESVALAKDLAAGCTQGNLDLLPHASTRNTARDMDLIRRDLGEQKISYLGYSYGSYLGAVYLQMFGAHADRVVLDSAPDPDVYGPDLISRDAPAAQAALAHWAAWAAGHDGEYGLGSTTGAVLATVDRVNQASQRHPLRVGSYALDEHVVPYFLFVHLYDDSDDSYGELAGQVKILAAAARDEPATPTPALDTFLAGLLTGAGYAADRAGTAVLCADRAVDRDPGTYLRAIEAHRGDEPLFGPLTHNITPCAFWPVAPAEKPTTIDNDVPALMVGADGDPVAPYPGQLAMHRALKGSRLLTLRGGFAHTEYIAAGNSCVDTTVNRYLVDGALPNRDVNCGIGS
ncbi:MULTISPECIES: alpha/beta hydrolase [Pseudofrankia]|uniref:alpha/beta hydrolase n=1 Tax=Pseudofrankia TaxID=2994363 RepID=UPI000234D610|nr:MULTISPECIES: alpha/beta hydrolase [Pseudofrankia]OHV35613.1 alpha/beta hydrolase [Pseudofrankia sp. EUN1h]